MHHTRLCHACVVALAWASFTLADTATHTATWLDTWHDPARRRDVPVKVYAPTDDGSRPIVIFSHGLGGSREGYRYLAEHWASQGYVVVMLQHPGSDDAVWRTVPPRDRMVALRKAAVEPGNLINRPLDVRFAIDTLTALNHRDGRLKDRLDLDRIGVAGHSFGAYTTLAVAGQSFPTRLGEVGLADPRVKAAIAMSAPVPGDPSRYAASYRNITMPVLHMTGTHDDSAIGDTPAAKRRVPFDHHPGGPGREQYLIILDGGDHMVFSGRRPRGDLASDGAHHALILAATTLFWDATLRGDADARNALHAGQLQRLADDIATVEVKP